jgi:hypothetical protein
VPGHQATKAEANLSSATHAPGEAMKTAVSRMTLLLFFGTLAACSSGNSASSCNNTCSTAGATQCSATQIQTCNADGSGCLAWSSPAACPSNQTCTAAQSKCTCNNTCPSAGATQCSGLQIQTCGADTSGCLAWSSPATCPGSLTCDLAHGTCIDHLVTINWAPNRESGVNKAGGGYQVSISGQPTINVPYASGSAAPTSATARLPTGTYAVTVRAYAALDAQGGTTGTMSAPSQSIMVTVP